MQDTKHTPGPWITDDRHIHPASGLTYPRGVEPETDVIVLVDTDQHADGLLNETDKANLRLIAAAPDLLEALEKVTNSLKHLPDIDCVKGMQEAFAAIAKAKGSA